MVILADSFVQTVFGAESVCPRNLSVALAFYYYLQGMIVPLENLRIVKGEYSDKYKQLGISIVNLIISVLLTYAFGVCGVVLGTILCYIFKAYILTPGVLFGSLFDENMKYDYLKHMIMFTILFCMEIWIVGGFTVSFEQSFLLNFLINGLMGVVGVCLFNFLILRKSRLYKENAAYFDAIINSWLRKIRKCS